MVKLTQEQKSFIQDVANASIPNVILFGKAGVGKTTTVNQLKTEASAVGLEYLVGAPTGVAAIKIGGTTVHKMIADIYNMPGGGWINENIAFILIDECSMLRADLFDDLDKALRVKGLTFKPFGGIKIVLAGDPGQLPPVVRKDDGDYEFIKDNYHSEFFFSAACYANSEWKVHELTKVFRQKEDDPLTDILNEIREGEKEQALRVINSECSTNSIVGTFLTPTNAAAEQINNSMLEQIDQTEYRFNAAISGEVKPNEYPTDEELTLKVGARVMVVKNIYRDADGRRFDPLLENYNDLELALVNGDTGEVTNIDYDYHTIEFFCDRTEESYNISIADGCWQKKAKIYDKKTKSLTEVVTGTFEQMPLRLAWAITIHKSQGATMENVTIDLRNPLFAAGQAYVAFSRATSLEGVNVLGRLRASDIKTHKKVKAYMKNFKSYVGIKEGSIFEDMQKEANLPTNDELTGLFAPNEDIKPAIDSALDDFPGDSK